MRIKHWQGYGTVEAKKLAERNVNGTHYVLVGVTGNHEWGLERGYNDVYGVQQWLGRFAKGEYLVDYAIVDHGYIRINGCDTEHVTYQLAFRKEN